MVWTDRYPTEKTHKTKHIRLEEQQEGYQYIQQYLKSLSANALTYTKHTLLSTFTLSLKMKN